jgi:ribosomal-protein-serine acetyltransferase
MLRIPARHELRQRPIASPRLYLTPVETSDSSDLWAAIDASRGHLEPWLPWVPYQTEPAMTLRFSEACVHDWDGGRALRLVLRNRTNRALLGVVGLESLQHMHLSCEIGYWLRHDMTGRGYMTEASRALLAWAFRDLGAHRVRVAASTENHASLGVIRRLGFRFEGVGRQAERVAGRWLDHATFSLLSTDDAARNPG